MKSRVIAAFFAFFLGGIGINNFYTEHNTAAVLDILFCWTFIPGIINLIRGIMYLFCDTDIDFCKKYVKDYITPGEQLRIEWEEKQKTNEKISR